MSCLMTGVGALASVGDDTDEVFAALCAPRSGLAPLRGLDGGKFRAGNAYEIDDRPGPGRATAWLIEVVAQALQDAGLAEDLTEVPVLVGTGLRELRSVELAWQGGTSFDLTRLHFGTALRERFGACQTYTFANACSASLHALAIGSDMLAGGMADAVVVAGTDTLTESMFGLLDRVQLDTPDRVLPFDRDRRGTLLGEGAAAVVLQRSGDESTRACGRLRATSMNCDAGHPTAPDPRGIADAIRQAHERAGVEPHEIDLVMLHGTGTALNDAAEAAAVDEVFGRHAGRPLMSAVKSMTGHTSGASGLLSLVVAARALESGRVPPVDGLTTPMPEAEHFRFARESRRDPDLRIAQVNAFGFGGVNAVAIVEAMARR